MSTFPTFALLDGQHRYAGLALEAFTAGDRSPSLLAYVGALPAWIVEWATSTTTHVWAPCSECGEGIFVVKPSVPQKPREALKDDDGPLCRLTWVQETVDTLTTTVRCRGRHYPMEGPWLASHPLARDLAPSLPW